jgi:MinD-like ATPase involved in chromosome partitioning or flagellar assembly
MVTAFWSLKGSSGTTSVCAAAAMLAAERSTEGVLLVDLAGDLAQLLQLADPAGPGVADWIRRSDLALSGDVERSVAPGLSVVTRGSGTLGGRRGARRLAGALGADSRAVFVDCGTLGTRDPADSVGATPSQVACLAHRQILVTRACSLSLALAETTAVPVSAVVVLREPGRAFGTDQIERVIGAPVVAHVDVDSSVARSVDSGSFSRQIPHVLRHALHALEPASGDSPDLDVEGDLGAWEVAACD